MNDIERIRGAVYRTVIDVNEFLPVEQALEPSDDLVLVGHDGRLDSMGFVNFIVALEEELERELGRDVNLADLLNMQTGDGDSIRTTGDVIDALQARLG